MYDLLLVDVTDKMLDMSNPKLIVLGLLLNEGY